MASRSLLLLAILGGCSPASTVLPYVPRVRQITLTTVPLLVRESKGVFPFLKEAFGPGGVLEGKEVYAFSPSTATVVEGDTVHFTVINPEDDEHWLFFPECSGDAGESFVLPDCAVRLRPLAETHATYIARHAGIFPFMCIVAKHVPMMNGQLVVLSHAAVTGWAGRGE